MRASWAGWREVAAALRPRRGATPLAWRNLSHKKTALSVSTAAVAFAVLIVFTQLGFLNGLYDSQTTLPRAVLADLFLASRARHLLVTHELFPRDRLEQARAVPGVAGVSALYDEDGLSFLRHPVTGVENAIRVLAFDLDEPVPLRDDARRLVPRLRQPLTVLFDRRSRRFFGPVREGTSLELAGRRVRVVGTFDQGTDFYYDGTVLTSTDTFFTLFAHRHPGRVMLGLVRLAAGADRTAVQRRLREALPPDVDVFTREEIVAREEAGWRKATPAGYVFGLGVVVGFVIGVIICYQILFTDINDHLPQLATLKAIGFHDRDLVGVVVRQSLLLGLLGFVPALLLASTLYSALTSLTGIVMRLTVARAALVLALTVLMALVSALLAVRRALAADPAELY